MTLHIRGRIDVQPKLDQLGWARQGQAEHHGAARKGDDGLKGALQRGS